MDAAAALVEGGDGHDVGGPAEGGGGIGEGVRGNEQPRFDFVDRPGVRVLGGRWPAPRGGSVGHLMCKQQRRCADSTPGIGYCTYFLAEAYGIAQSMRI